MKKILFFYFSLCAFSLIGQTAYVNSSASGSGDGTSWENAYTSLEDGLKDEAAQELWIAAGTYIPSSTDSGYFFLNRNINLYGGFMGNESSVEERNISSNRTILSADINGDDIDGDFTQNKSDNALHVLVIRDADKTQQITIDGFTIQGGNTLDDGDLEFLMRSGGGIASDNPLKVANCFFRNNFGRSGAALVIVDSVRTAPCEISNSMFQNNSASSQGTAFVIVDSVMVQNSIFRDNNNARGAFYPLNSRSVRIDNATFENNININGTGGGIFAIGNQFFEITNTAFEKNFATFQGGGIYNSQSDFPLEPSLFKIDNCSFSENMCSDTAGSSSAIRMWQNKNIEITNSTFMDNFARSGGTVSSNQSDLADTELRGNVLIENCLFEANALVDTSSGFGGALFFWQNKNVEISKTQFKVNRSFSAGCIYYDARNIVSNPDIKNRFLVRDCLFEQNTCAGFGGAISLWQGTGIQLLRDTFLRNAGSSAGAVSYNGSNTLNQDLTVNTNPDNLVLNDCIFRNNRGTAFGGGGIYCTTCSMTMNDVEFTNNTADNGAHLFNTGDAKRTILNRVSFSGGTSNFGGAMTNYGAGAYTTLNNCTFRENNAQNNGGAINQGFQARLEVFNSSFQSNSSNFGGAINAFSDTSFVLIQNSVFNDNSAANNGGAVNGAGGPTMEIIGTEFTGNFANFGGGLSYGGNGLDTGNLVLSLSTFTENGAGNQGGAVNIFNGNVQVANTLIFFNEAEGNGTGGGISFNASDSVVTEMSIINSTIAANFGQLAAGIAVFTDSFPETGGTLVLQNTALRNEGVNFAIEDGQPTLVSKGGNISFDDTMESFLTDAKDQNNTAPGFTSYDDLMFTLADGSPCIDAGVEDNAPTTDLQGLGRNGIVDIGAYEFDGIVLSNPEILDNQFLNIKPNPVVEDLNLELENDWQGQVNVFISNINGQLIHFEKFIKNNEKQLFRVPVEQLTEGSYVVFLEHNNQRISKVFIKN